MKAQPVQPGILAQDVPAPVDVARLDGSKEGSGQARAGLLTFTLKAVAYALYVLAGLNVFAAIGRVAMIGKPRRPVTGGDALASVVFCATVATVLVIAAIRLG